MVKQRDELGRFVKGNTVAKGNKGNTNSKWGNQNALKHGLYARTYNYTYKILEDGTLNLNNGVKPLLIRPAGYKVINERIYIRDDLSEQLQRWGYGLLND